MLGSLSMVLSPFTRSLFLPTDHPLPSSTANLRQRHDDEFGRRIDIAAALAAKLARRLQRSWATSRENDWEEESRRNSQRKARYSAMDFIRLRDSVRQNVLAPVIFSVRGCRRGT